VSESQKKPFGNITGNNLQISNYNRIANVLPAMSNTSLFRGLGVVIGLVILVAAGHFGLPFIEEPRREILAILVGAAATIFAGWLAWESATAKERRDERDRVDRAAASKQAAIVALAQPVHAASIWLAKLIEDLRAPGDRDGKSLRAKRLARELDHVLDRDLLLVLAPDLGADDLLDMFIIYGTMRAPIAMSEMRSEEIVLSTDDLVRIGTALAQLQAHLKRFDANLGEVFTRDSEIERGISD